MINKEFNEILKSNLELLSRLEHEQWESWTKGLVKEFGDRLPKELIDRWKSNWVDYSDLDESVKDKDRKWAKKVITELYK